MYFQSAFSRSVSQPSALLGADINPQLQYLKPAILLSFSCMKEESFGRCNLPFFRDFIRDCLRAMDTCGVSRGWAVSTHSAAQGRDCPRTGVSGIFSQLTFSSCFVLPMWCFSIPGSQPLRDAFLGITAANQHQYQLVLKLTWAGVLTTSASPVLITPSKLPSPCYSDQSKAQLTLHLLLNLAWHFETSLCNS